MDLRKNIILILVLLMGVGVYLSWDTRAKRIKEYNEIIVSERNRDNEKANNKKYNKLISKGYKKLDKDNYEETRELFQEAIELDPENAWGYYHIACTYSREGVNKESIEYLTKSFDYGFDDYHHFFNDPDLETIRNLSEFEQIFSNLLDKSIENYLELVETESEAVDIYYYKIAQIYAFKQEKEKTMEYLEKAYDNGYNFLIGSIKKK